MSNSNRTSRIRCVLLDFDGTLVDSFSLVLRHYARIGPQYGCRVPSAEDGERLRGLHAREVLAELDVPYRRIPQIVMQLREAVRSELLELAPVPGIREMIRALAGAGYELGIVSSNGKENIRAYLSRHRIADIGLIGTSNLLLGKSKVLVKIARSHGFSLPELLYVGDELRDFDAARSAGCRFAAVAWGYTNVKALKDKGAELICRSPADLLAGVLKL